MNTHINQAELNALVNLLATKPLDAGIDSSALLTMLSFVVAAWAIVPNATRLKLRLSLSVFDWTVIGLAIIVIHFLFFEEPLRSIGLYPILGPWSWGFDKATTQYSLFLVPVVLVAVRSFRTRLSLRRLPLFEKLAVELLHTRKFEELAHLFDHHLPRILEIANGNTARGWLEAWIRPKVVWTPPVFLKNGTVILAPKPGLGVWGDSVSRLREWLANRVAPAKARQSAQAIARTALSSREFVSYMALARPYLCTHVMAQASLLVEEFQDEFFVALLASEASVLYAELKNNENLVGRGGRYRLPEENELVRFYLQDVRNAGTLGVFRSLGEAVLSRVDTDDNLLKKLNGPLLMYQDRDKRRCPIYSGIHFFDVMVQEGLHQRSDDHLWLHYFRHFTEHLLKRARALEPDDENHEFATPLTYLLYALINTASHWIGEAAYLTKEGDVISDEDTHSEHHVYISFQAAEVLGGMLEAVLSSNNVSERLKRELLDVPIYTLKLLEMHKQLHPLAQALANNLAYPYGISQVEYLEILRRYFQKVDPPHRIHAHRLEVVLNSAAE